MLANIYDRAAQALDTVKTTAVSGLSGLSGLSTFQRPSRSGWLLIASIFGLLILVFLIYLLIAFIYKRAAIIKSAAFLSTPVSASVFQKVTGPPIPTELNGQRMTVSFWVYISNVDQYAGMYRHILHLGDESVASASPVIFLDKTSNRIVARFSKLTPDASDNSFAANYKAGKEVNVSGLYQVQKAPSSPVTSIDVAPADALNVNDHGIVLPYIPLQRWVHVAIVADETANGGMLTAYLDADSVVQVKNGDDYDDAQGNAFSSASSKSSMPTGFTQADLLQKNVTNLLLNKSGNLYVGGDIYSQGGPGFNGYISQVEFFNYNLNQQDIAGLYAKGPYVQSLMNKMGMPAYGLRNPVYKVDGS